VGRGRRKERETKRRGTGRERKRRKLGKIRKQNGREWEMEREMR